MADGKEQRAAAAAVATAEYEVMARAGQGDRYRLLDFVKTFIVGEFEPFIFGDKKRVRSWMLRNGACFDGEMAGLAMTHEETIWTCCA